MRFLSLTFFLCLSFLTNAQILEPVKWRFDSNQTGPDTYDLFFIAEMENEWKVYSQFTGDDGPVPTSVTYESGNVELLDDKSENGDKKEGYDKMFETNVVAFTWKKPFMIKHKIRLTDPSKPIVGYLTYMTCNSETCLPPTDVDFKFSYTVKGGTEKINRRPDGTLEKENIQAPIQTKSQDVKQEVIKKTETSKPKIQIQPIKEEKPQDKVEVQPIEVDKVEGSSFVLNESESREDNSQLKDPVKWNIDIKDNGGGNYDLIYTAKMDKGWTVYSLYTDDNGPYPTTITFEDDGGAQVIGKPTEAGYKKQGPDPLFDNVEVIKYLDKQPFVITQKIKSETGKNIKGYLTYMACDNSGCLPPTDVEFGFDLKNVKMFVPGTEVADAAGINNPFDSNELVDQRVPSMVSTYKTPIGNCKGGEEEQDKGLVTSFIFGFLGGLLALLTPCVFPMIPLTVSFFTKDTKRKGWVNGAIYGLSIIVIYVTMGLLLTWLVGPDALNRLSTNWIANTLFFLIFVAFAFSFFGYYEITLPSSWSTKSDAMADKGGFIGIFFMAFTLALVSFSCTGPIIGSAIVSAASNAIGPAVVMTGFAIALALPFGLFAAFPAWLNTLPQSGGWMNSVKVFLGFLELALAFKFLSVADMTNNWGFLKYELFMGIWVIIFALMTAYWFGLIKFPHDSPVKKLSLPRKIFAFLSLAFTVYLASGFMMNKKTENYQALNLMSGLAPPAHYNFFIPSQEVDKSIKEKYPSYTMCANNIPCFKDYYEGKAYAKEVNKMIFLDFTGHGCVNCRKVEEHIWVRDEIRDKLINDCVLISLYVDDDKKFEKTSISTRDNYKIRNVGNKWTDFQIANFAQNTQPLYVMMTLDEKVIAKPRGYRSNEGVKEYNEYLECGLETFANNK